MQSSAVTLSERSSVGLQIAVDNSSVATDIMSGDTFMEEMKTFTVFKVAMFLVKYWFPILVPIALIGNVLSFLVMIKPNNRKMSTCIYMAAISINDNLQILLALHTWLVTTLEVHERYAIECKIKVSIALMSLQNSTFQVLAMTIDKYIAIKWPHKAASYSTPRRVKITVIVACIVAIIYNIPHFFLTGVIGRSCVSYSVGGVITKIYSWLTFVINAMIPFTLLIYMNFVIVKTVKRSRKMFITHDTIAGTVAKQNENERMETRMQKTMKSAENQVTIMVLLVTTLFLVLLFPTYARCIYQSFIERDTPYKYASSKLFYEIGYKLYSTNSGINFFLYCISGQKFRNDLKEIFCSIVMYNDVSNDNGSESLSQRS